MYEQGEIVVVPFPFSEPVREKGETSDSFKQ